MALFLLWMLACAGSKDPVEPLIEPTDVVTAPVESTPVDVAPLEPSPGDPTAADGPTPAKLYEACRERVESPEADGECKVDADCARAGCGSEVCTPVAKRADVLTTCEVKPCFQILDACGCQAGRCRWSLEAEMPKGHLFLPAADDPR